ncbi:GGDEF domain-containing protein [Paraburkholderia sp.]|uniref:GGDEF domain-containing protein n=1 Tax=Paraburkholderia sp. TaxID=1926495 RepID=UPI00239B8F07|nr:GGDEF domain-containing protein [Paraburkholderia sp.]MDE1181077.1 GGDEF domain-containing protein [Paraburkholderia sp.]
MLNPVSLLFVTALSGVMATAMLCSLLRAAIPGVAWWIAANAVAIVAVVCVAGQGHIAPWISIVLANLLVSVALLFMLDGCHRFLGRRRLLADVYLGVAGTLAGLIYWTYVSPDFAARVAMMSAFNLYIYAQVAWVMWRGRPLKRSAYSYYFLIVSSVLFCIGHLARGAMYGFGQMDQHSLLQATPLNIAFLAIGILALPCMTIGSVMLAHDRMATRLETLANIDDLTGSLARRAFLARAQAALSTAARAQRPLSLAIIDIDRFKSINDTHGHAVGDSVLRHFTAFVESHLRPDDLFGRLGGEEFGVICPATDLREAVAVLERLQEQLSALEQPLPGVAAYTFSVGVDEYRGGDTLSVLMARADAALYVAKASGRNRVIAAMPSGDRCAGNDRPLDSGVINLNREDMPAA